ncbi:MAG: sigma-70 family RNA polymerase sigma factor [Actinomycetota bacterium]|nr:sigma-70 family RNA polymerase sigma factor [Actinomycetota bacterium]
MADVDLHRLGEAARLIGQRWFRDPEDVADLVQSTLAAYLAASEHVRKPLPWVRRVAHNLAVTEIDRREWERAAVARLSFVEEMVQRPFADEVVAKVMIEQILEDLTPREREVWTRRHLQGEPRKTIAEGLGVSDETIKTLLHRAGSKFKKLAAVEGGEASA